MARNGFKKKHPWLIGMSMPFALLSHKRFYFFGKCGEEPLQASILSAGF